MITAMMIALILSCYAAMLGVSSGASASLCSSANGAPLNLGANAAGAAWGPFSVFAGANSSVYYAGVAQHASVPGALSRSGIVGVSGDGVLAFAGGLEAEDRAVSSRVDLFWPDLSSKSGRWSLCHLSRPRTGLTGAAIGRVFAFAGQGAVEIMCACDSSGAEACPSTTVGGNFPNAPAAAYDPRASDNTVMFAGGSDATSARADVAIVDVIAGTVRPGPTPLAEARQGPTGARIGDAFAFIGGVRSDGSFSNFVDIFFANLGFRAKTVDLGIPLAHHATAVAGGHIYVAGGVTHSNAPTRSEILTISADWAVAPANFTLGQPARDLVGAGVGTKNELAAFAGGVSASATTFAVC